MKKIVNRVIKSKVGKFIISQLISEKFSMLKQELAEKGRDKMTLDEALDLAEKKILEKLNA